MSGVETIITGFFILMGFTGGVVGLLHSPILAVGGVLMVLTVIYAQSR